MSIQAAEIKKFRSAVVGSGASNGGVMSASEVVSGVSSNLFPSATLDERTAGAIQFRKMFMKVDNAENLTLISPRVWQDTNTVGDDRLTFCEATQRNAQGQLTGAEDYYGVGKLHLSVLAGATSIQVETESGLKTIFRDGDLIRISDKTNPMLAGNEQWVRISGVPTVFADLVTINLATPLAAGYAANATRVASVLEVADVKTSCSTPTTTSVAGAVTVGAGDLVGDNIGTVEQTWTLTFTSPSNFTIAGDLLGYSGAGTIATLTSPLNPGNGKPYFTLKAEAFGGTFTAGDTVVFSTHPASIPLFLERVIPAGAAAVSGSNTASFYVDGESE